MSPARGGARLSTAWIHQHALLVPQAPLECAIAASPFLLNFLRRLGFGEGAILLDDGRFCIVFSCRDKGAHKRFQNRLPDWVGEICGIENRTQAGLGSFGFRLGLVRSYLTTAQFFPKRQNSSVSRRAVSPKPNFAQSRLYLSLEGLVVRVENSREVSIGAVGRRILKNESAAFGPRRWKSDFTSRTIRQRMSNCHFVPVLNRGGCPGSITIRRIKLSRDSVPRRTGQ
jgi:hypothetical protein